MSISTGMDRLGKVVFWLSLLAMAIVSGLLTVGTNGSEKYGWILGGLTVFVVIIQGHDGKRIPVWGTSAIVWYNLIIVAFLMNKLPNADGQLMALAWFAPLVLYCMAYLIGRYILRGFTPKT